MIAKIVDIHPANCENRTVNLEKIRRQLKGGFRPFVIRTSDGREYKVPHPEFVMIGKYEVAVVDGSGDIDLLDPLHIVSLKSLAGRAGSPKTFGGN